MRPLWTRGAGPVPAPHQRFIAFTYIAAAIDSSRNSYLMFFFPRVVILCNCKLQIKPIKITRGGKASDPYR